jgi:hypothetical protein
MSEAMRQRVVANVLDYAAGSNEPNVATRLQILERCLAEDGATSIRM